MKKFKKRHNIRCIRIHGEKLSADKDESDKFCQDFLQYVTEKQIPLNTVYNADETGLNWKILETEHWSPVQNVQFQKGKHKRTELH